MGEMENPSAIGKVGNPVCGDVMWIYIKVNDKTDVIEDIKVKTFGCVAAIATSSKTTQLALGKTLKEAYEITKKRVAEELGGLPKQKMHCSNLAVDALQKAIIKYLEENNRTVEEFN
ncbi:MAG: iron-sulfur cluster assembly scaffold protein [Candidatus Hodarchaeales archaeon]|jgi:nitrogen fixation NifU-like protein